MFIKHRLTCQLPLIARHAANARLHTEGRAVNRELPPTPLFCTLAPADFGPRCRDPRKARRRLFHDRKLRDNIVKLNGRATSYFNNLDLNFINILILNLTSRNKDYIYLFLLAMKYLRLGPVLKNSREYDTEKCDIKYLEVQNTNFFFIYIERES